MLHVKGIKKGRYSIRFILSGIFFMNAIVFIVVLMGVQYYFEQDFLQEDLFSSLDSNFNSVSEYLHRVDDGAVHSIGELKHTLDSLEPTASFSNQWLLKPISKILENNPFIQSIYIGKNNEDAFQVINLSNSSVVQKEMKVKDNEYWCVIRGQGIGGDRIVVTSYLTKDFTVTRESITKDDFYPTKRPWFISSREDKINKTSPYKFKGMSVTGQSYSIRSGENVIGLDVELTDLKQKLSAIAVDPEIKEGIESFIFDNKGEIIASDSDLPQNRDVPSSTLLQWNSEQKKLLSRNAHLFVVRHNISGSYKKALAKSLQGYTADILKLVSKKTGIEFSYIEKRKNLSSIEKKQITTVGVVGLGEHLQSKSATLFKIRLAIAGEKSLPKLNKQSQITVGTVGEFGIKQWLYSQYPKMKIVEFENLSMAKNAVHDGTIPYIIGAYASLTQQDWLGQNTNLKIRKLDNKPLSVGLYLDKSSSALLDLVNMALASISPQEHSLIKSKWITNRGAFISKTALEHLVKRNHESSKMMEQTTAEGELYIHVSPISTLNGSEDYFVVTLPKKLVTKAILKRLYSSLMISGFLVVSLFLLLWKFSSPLVRYFDELRDITTEIRSRRFEKVKPIETNIVEISDLSNAIVKMSNEIGSHEKQQQAFVEAFIEVIANAIDDKSPYTAGHCNRVPEIGLMLLDAVEKTKKGKFKDFALKNDAERREFRIAAWLHDCGKITTPEHIVDKGTKLETNYNRINEVRTRFEVLRRDAEISYLRERLSKDANIEQAREAFERRVEQLDDDFKFIAEVNIGSEYVDEEKIRRIEKIGQQIWLRYFDDNIGLSPFEEMNKPKLKVKLPVAERLLADKPEHLIERERPVIFEPHHKIKMKVPKYKYNLGEIHNLSISRGTLTDEDRFKINEHMISGIKILESLPFPQDLSNVPRYASTHHETLIGTGYPRGLSADDLSIPERILMIADIFEALTAADRPYKKAKPISVALDIMYSLAIQEHLDMDLFLLFLKSGVYRKYAEKFIPDEQIDDVNIYKYFKHA